MNNIIMNKQNSNKLGSQALRNIAQYVVKDINNSKRPYINETEFYHLISTFERGKVNLPSFPQNRLYYYLALTLHLAGQTSLPRIYFYQHMRLPTILTNEEEAEYYKVACQLKYSSTTIRYSIRALNKILLYERISLKEVRLEQIIKSDWSTCIINVLLALGVIKNLSPKIKDINFSSYLSCSIDLQQIYLGYLNEINREIEATRRKREKIVRFLLNFLSSYGVTNTEQIDKENLKAFIKWLETEAPSKIGATRSKETVNTDITRLKAFLIFLDEKQLLSEAARDFLYEIDSYRYPIADKRHKPVPRKDIEVIERSLYGMDENGENWFVKRALILCYLSAGRPSEVLSLWFDCVRGTPEVPLLYFHRGKHFSERYVPMTEEIQRIVEEVKRSDLLRIPIFSEYDNYSVKRLFGFRGTLPSIAHMNRVFNRLQLEASSPLTDSHGNAKYSIYELRRIRITKWLEAGIPETDVAQMAGHFSGVDNHNAYIVGAESRKVNCWRAYEKYYKGRLFSEDKIEELAQDAGFCAESFIAELATIAERIESSGLRDLVLEEMLLRQPELLLPVPCGYCAQGLGASFCNLLERCILCDKVIVDLERIQKWVAKLFRVRRLQEKKNMGALVHKTESIIAKLRVVCTAKLGFSSEEVAKRFNYIERHCLRGGGKGAYEKY